VHNSTDGWQNDMTATSLITLRETLEASLVVGIVLAYFNVAGYQKQNTVVWMGVLCGVASSLLLAVLFRMAFGGFEGRAEKLYEGSVMLIGACLLTWMIWWMFRQRHSLKKHIEQHVELHMEAGYMWGIFFLVYFAVLREGIETVIFLQAALVHTGGWWHMLGGFLGIATAMTLSVLLYKGILHVSLKQFFAVTNVLLVLFAAGLVAHGIHEFQEAGVLPFAMHQPWDSTFLLDENGTIGSIMKGLFGYNANPSFLEITGYLLYFGCIIPLWMYERRRSAKKV
jgi:high-affinity iron transporter